MNYPARGPVGTVLLIIRDAPDFGEKGKSLAVVYLNSSSAQIQSALEQCSCPALSYVRFFSTGHATPERRGSDMKALSATAVWRMRISLVPS